MAACVWVDDVVIADNSQKTRDDFVKKLHATFPLDDKGALEWILGIHVKRNIPARSLTLSQELYTLNLLFANNRRYYMRGSRNVLRAVITWPLHACNRI